MDVDDLVLDCNGILSESRELDLQQSIPYCPFLPKPDCLYVRNERVRDFEVRGETIVKVKYYTCGKVE